MTSQTLGFDVIIIGGGPAGIMAALSVKENHSNKTVAILDKTFELGRKLLVSGSGRGNLTNVHLMYDTELFYHGDNTLILSVFKQFGYDNICTFFNTIGISLYEEIKTNRGKIFPTVDNAKTIRDILVRELEMAGVNIFLNTTVHELNPKDSFFTLQTNKGSYTAEKIIIACGGKTYPSLGSDGSGYELAKQIGHTIKTPVPSAVPLVSKNQFSHFLQGEKMIMKASSMIDEQFTQTTSDDVLFTQYGLSGPAIFDISRDISIRINREDKIDTKVSLSFFPNKSESTIRDELTKRIEKYKNRPVAEILWGLMSVKFSGAICAVLKFPKEKQAGTLTSDEIESLIDILFHTKLQVEGTRGWNEAEFTAGGINTNEINTQTLESLHHKNVYFAGEILDVDGNVGGFNLSWAWSSGWVAGKLQ